MTRTEALAAAEKHLALAEGALRSNRGIFVMQAEAQIAHTYAVLATILPEPKS